MVAAVLGLPVEPGARHRLRDGRLLTATERSTSTPPQAAALMSQAVGAPVRVQLMRWDEIGWDNTSPGSLMDVRAGIDAKGNLVAFDFTHFYPQYQSENVRRRAPS